MPELPKRDLATPAQIGAFDSLLDSLGDGIGRRDTLRDVNYAGRVIMFVSPAQELPRQGARNRGRMSRKNADLSEQA